MSATTVSLYDISVPVFVRALKIMSAFLAKAEKHDGESKLEHIKCTEARLTPDMLPLTFQVQCCCNTAKATLPRLTGAEPVKMEDNETSFSDLQAKIAKTIAILEGADRATFDKVRTDAKVAMKFGDGERTFTAQSYLLAFTLPNFFFHEAMAYAVLRNAGMPLGKRDFLGSEQCRSYPALLDVWRADMR